MSVEANLGLVKFGNGEKWDFGLVGVETMKNSGRMELYCGLVV
jgi:hypothetical protein